MLILAWACAYVCMQPTNESVVQWQRWRQSICAHLGLGMCRAIRPGNSDMCGWVPDRLANVTGLKTGYLGNCSALPPPRPRPIIQPLTVAPAPAPVVSAFSIPAQVRSLGPALQVSMCPF